MSREIAKRIEKLAQDAKKIVSRQVAAIILDLPRTSRPDWLEPLPDGRSVLIGLGDAPSRAAVLDDLRAGRTIADDRALVQDYRRTVSAFIADAAAGYSVDGLPRASEVAVISPRGEGKSQGVLGAMEAHALLHLRHGFKGPVRWLIVGATATYLEESVAVSMTEDIWRSAWSYSNKIATLTIDGTVLVRASFAGVDEAGDVDYLRRGVHGVWTEEPASAVAEMSAGISRKAWAVAVSSARLPSHHNPALLSSNAPSPKAWVWKRYVLSPEPGCRAYRIPKAERTTDEYRERLKQQLADSPDMYQRLGEGDAALPILGLQVAKGYSDRLCVSPHALEPIQGPPFYVGFDAGLTPAATICQARDGRCFVYAAPTIERGGTKELIELYVLPWFQQHAPWALRESGAIIACCDPNMKTPSQHSLADSPDKTVRSLLRAWPRYGPVRWAPRRDALLSCFMPGRSRLWISPIDSTEDLRLGLGGGFHYRSTRGGDVTGQEPVKDGPSHVCDALIYVLCELWPAVDRDHRRGTGREQPRYAQSTTAIGWGSGRPEPPGFFPNTHRVF
jgi:hypothetical protein